MDIFLVDSLQYPWEIADRIAGKTPWPICKTLAGKKKLFKYLLILLQQN